MKSDLENIDSIEKKIQDKKAVNYDELFFQSIAQFPLRKKIANYLREKNVPKSARIIDVGCGTGELLLFLWNEGYNTLFGNDISEGMLDVAKRKVSKATFFHGSINKVEIPEKFDYIIITEALHHIPDLKMTFKSLEQLLQPDGEIVLLEPNEKWFFEKFYTSRSLTDLLVYLPVAPFLKYARLKNKTLIEKNSKFDTPDTFNPFHRHLTVEEVKDSTDMQITFSKYFTFYMGFFEGALFKAYWIDKLIYSMISILDSLIPFGDCGKYFFLVLKKGK